MYTEVYHRDAAGLARFGIVDRQITKKEYKDVKLRVIVFFTTSQKLEVAISDLIYGATVDAPLPSWVIDVIEEYDTL